MEKRDKQRRLLGVLLLLQDQGGRIRFSELRERFPDYDTAKPETGRRKFERDKEDLAALGVHLEHLGHEDDYAYRLDVKGSFLTEPVELDEAERALLAGLAREAMDSEGFPYRSLLRVALSKLGVSPETAGSLLVRHPVRDQNSVTGGMVELFAEAVLSQKRVCFMHGWAHRQGFRREIEPYGLFLHHGHWYLCGRCVDLDDVRVFRFSKIQDAKVNASSPATPDFEIPEDFSLFEHAHLDPVRYRAHEPLLIEIRVDQEVDHLAKKMWGGPSEEDSTLFRVETTNSSAVVEQVLGLGNRAEILGPTDAREEIRSVLGAILHVHGEPS